MDTDFKAAAREIYKALKDRAERPGWLGYSDVYSTERMHARLREALDKAGGDAAILDESGQSTTAQMEEAVEALIQNCYLRYVELVAPSHFENHVTDVIGSNDLDALLDGLSSLRTAFERSGKAAAHIDPIEFEQRLADAETRFRQEAAALRP